MIDKTMLAVVISLLLAAAIILMLFPTPTCQPGRHIVAFPHGGLACVEDVR